MKIQEKINPKCLKKASKYPKNTKMRPKKTKIGLKTPNLALKTPKKPQKHRKTPQKPLKSTLPEPLNIDIAPKKREIVEPAARPAGCHNCHCHRQGQAGGGYYCKIGGKWGKNGRK
jgi:hypothetical protein